MEGKMCLFYVKDNIKREKHEKQKKTSQDKGKETRDHAKNLLGSCSHNGGNVDLRILALDAWAFFVFFLLNFFLFFFPLCFFPDFLCFH